MTTQIEYNGSVVATIPNGNTATLSIADKKMKSDIIITVPEVEGDTASAIPTEVSTEAEMTALLTSGEVGGVYKYTGTTGTYENGALYVLEEEASSQFTVRVNNENSVFSYVEGNTWEDINGAISLDGKWQIRADSVYMYPTIVSYPNSVPSGAIETTNQQYLSKSALIDSSLDYFAYATHSGGAG